MILLIAPVLIVVGLVWLAFRLLWLLLWAPFLIFRSRRPIGVRIEW